MALAEFRENENEDAGKGSGHCPARRLPQAMENGVPV